MDHAPHLQLIACSLVAAAFGAAACNETPSERAPRRPGGSGARVVGAVSLLDGERLPSYRLSDLTRMPRDRPASLFRPERCAGADTKGLHPVQQGPSGGLSNVVVAASGFTSFAERKAVRHRVRIVDCMLTPKTLSATDGDKLIVENAEGSAYQPVFGVRVHADTLQPGEQAMFPLVGGGIESVMCTASARCGRSDVVVLHHPLHTVTGGDGEFRLDDFPTGQPVHLHAWHPLFEESSTVVWLEPGEEQKVSLALKPRKF